MKRTTSGIWHGIFVRTLLCMGLGWTLFAAEAWTPTADEVDVLTSINRHRNDRTFGDHQLYQEIKRAFNQLEMSFFGLNGREPAQPPIVFSQSLMTAARTLLTKGITPVSYEPVDHAPVFSAVSYQPASTGLILCGFGLASPKLAYLTSFAQTNGKIVHSTGFVQPIHGGPGLLAGNWREAGIATQTIKGRTSLVLVLGAGSATRYLGGQVYADENRNDICDLGEGIVGASVTVGEKTLTTGQGGIWWIDLVQSEPGEIKFTWKEHQAIRNFPGGTTNQTIDYRLPNTADVATAKRLVAIAEKASKGPEEGVRKSLVSLLSMTRSTDLDDDLRTRVDALTRPVQSSFDDTIHAIRRTLALDPQEYKIESHSLQKNWDGALSSWFQEWDNLYKIRCSVREVLAMPSAEQAPRARVLLKTIRKSQTQTTDPDIRLMYTEFISSLQHHEEAGPTVKKKSK